MENNDSVVHRVSSVVRRECGIAQDIASIGIIETDSVDIERFYVSLSKGVLHGSLKVGIWSDVVEPGGIQGPGRVLELETETGSIIILIQDIDLSLDLGIPEMYRSE